MRNQVIVLDRPESSILFVTEELQWPFGKKVLGRN